MAFGFLVVVVAGMALVDALLAALFYGLLGCLS
jgi:hypothetical protein